MKQPIVCGVYCLFLRHQLVYIGKSKNAYGRIEDHRRNGKEFDYATVSPCPLSDLDWIEAAMISAMETRHNRTGRPKSEKTTHHHREIVREVRIVPAREMNADAPMSMPEAIDAVRENKLSTTLFRKDVRDGTIPSFGRTPGRPAGVGNPRVITWGVVDAWCRKHNEARLAARSA